jgi:putative transcriptional regulator
MALVPAQSIAEQFELKVDPNHSDVQIFWGGPVHSSRGFFLHSPDYTNEGSNVIAEGVVLTGNNEILGAILEGRGPTNSIFALGCAGWGPGQLERELSREDWFVLQTKSEFIFEADPFEMWAVAMDQLSIEL